MAFQKVKNLIWNISHIGRYYVALRYCGRLLSRTLCRLIDPGTKSCSKYYDYELIKMETKVVYKDENKTHIWKKTMHSRKCGPESASRNL